MNAEPIPVLLADNSIVHVMGFKVDCYTLGPVILWNGSPNWERTAIRGAETGINIAAFTDKQVALGFLRWLVTTYGDISDTLQRCADGRETAEDRAILDAINERSRHAARVYASENFE
jgi:hypothetical protein